MTTITLSPNQDYSKTNINNILESDLKRTGSSSNIMLTTRAEKNQWFINSLWFKVLLFYAFFNYSSPLLINFFQILPGFYKVPDTGRDILIESRGFQYERHFFQTQDGYISQIVRIVNPYVENRTQHRPVILFHGYQCSGAVWLVANNGYLDSNGNYIEFDENNQVINGSVTTPNSLGFVLSANGYDVWVANYRGSIYSSNHSRLNAEESEEYWKFSMDEMIHFDLPKMIDYILEQTQHETLSYIGHSQGSTLMLALMSISDEYQQKVKPFISLSPCWYNTNLTSILSKLTIFRTFERTFPRRSFLHNMRPASTILSNLCSNRLIQYICYNIYNSFVGYKPSNIRLDRLPVYLYNVPAGASSWNNAQQLQSIESNGPVEYFDYGPEKNLERYGQRTPPKYDASKVNSTHMAFFYAKHDRVNPMSANELLKKDLRVKLMVDYMIPDDDYDHMSFLWAKNVGQLINKKVLNLLAMYD